MQEAIKLSLSSVAQSEEVKGALAKLVESAFSSEESTRTIVQLLKKGIKIDMKGSLTRRSRRLYQELSILLFKNC